MEQPPELCPFSFGFSLKQQTPNIIDHKKVDLRIQVGFPCIKAKCHFYYVPIQDCIAWEILKKLDQLVSEEENVK